MKIGDVLEFTEKQKNVIKVHTDLIVVARVAFHEASKRIRSAENALWDTIHSIHPIAKGIKCSLEITDDNDDYTILLMEDVDEK